MEIEQILKAILGLVFVVALIGLSAFLFQKFAMGRNFINKGQPKRLKIVEYLMLDAKRKLVLVKKDNQEILLLLGDSREQLLEISGTPKTATRKQAR